MSTTTVKCALCNSICGHYVCKHCGYAFQVPCKKHPSHRAINRCPSCDRSW